MPQPDVPAPPRHARNVERAVTRYGDLGRAWVAGLWQGDEPADAVAADLAGISRERGRAHRRRLVDRAIAGDPDPDQPASLTALLAGLEVEPDWVDHDQLDRAGDHLTRNSAQLGITLAAASLMVGYTNPAAAKPLVLTGRLVDDAGVRNLEVGDWLREVTTHGGMRRDGLGFERTVRVRLIHADVRRFVARHPEWDPDVLGTPVSQPYMAHTLAEFGCIALDAMAVLGARYSAAERDDIYALWRYVGLVSGVARSCCHATRPSSRRSASSTSSPAPRSTTTAARWSAAWSTTTSCPRSPSCSRPAPHVARRSPAATSAGSSTLWSARTSPTSSASPGRASLGPCGRWVTCRPPGTPPGRACPAAPPTGCDAVGATAPSRSSGCARSTP